jgi:leader peptidase (prepilin peptidase)/N-methyltransferase
MSGHELLLPAICAAVALAVAPFLTRLTHGLVASRSTSDTRAAGLAAVAVTTAAGFVATALHFGWSAELPPYLFLVAVLVVLSFVDLATKTLPRRVVHVALLTGILFLAPISLLTGEPERLLWATLGAVGAFAALTVLHLAARGGFGYGDVRLGAMLGWYLAWQGLRYVPVGFFLAFVLSAVTGLALMALGRARRRTAIPFGPFLAVGAALALVGGPVLVNGA